MPPETPSSSNPPHATNCDVVVIDDDREVREVIVRALRLWGYSVEAAENGQAALELISRRTFRLVLTDIYMPQMDGFEVVMKLTDVEPRPAVVVMSGGGRGAAKGDLKIAELLGCEHTLVKPFSLLELKSVVEILIGPPETT